MGILRHPSQSLEKKKKRQLKKQKQKQNKLDNSVVKGRVSHLLRRLCCCCCCCWWWWWWWPVDVEKKNKQTTKLGNSIVPSSRKS